MRLLHLHHVAALLGILISTRVLGVHAQNDDPLQVKFADPNDRHVEMGSTLTLSCKVNRALQFAFNNKVLMLREREVDGRTVVTELSNAARLSRDADPTYYDVEVDVNQQFLTIDFTIRQIREVDAATFMCKALSDEDDTEANSTLKITIRKCRQGSYGEGCSKRCSDHCIGEDNSCNEESGTCDLGCDPGYEGGLCIEKCRRGSYGENCSETCSEFCAGRDSSCDHISGACDLGCDAGYRGAMCITKCSLGHYGEGCSKKCSENCLGDRHQCDHVSGACDLGCVTGYHGDMCTKEGSQTDTGVFPLSLPFPVLLLLSLVPVLSRPCRDFLTAM